ncbi:hypothetical protein GCM10010191_12190 [Actinomadura vinacea]|uniref:Tetracycline repressor TetR C-terminal domain-containing protein n=1 Tax=Actinomadura vinacea TaxID=115336 RepID=A0ABN3IIH0_9ACTN
MEEPLPDDWREAISMIARREYETLLRHPWMADLATRPRVGPNALRHGEQSLAALSRLDIGMKDAAKVVMAVDHYMTGYFVRGRLLRARGDDTDDQSEPYMHDMLATGSYPRLQRAHKEGMDDQEPFEQGLAWLLDGIEREYRG